MFNEFNPVFRSNPFYKSLKKIQKWEQMKEIPSKEIDDELIAMQEISDGLEVGLTKVHFGDKNKIREFKRRMDEWIKQIRSDLDDTSKFIHRETFYEKVSSKNSGSK